MAAPLFTAREIEKLLAMPKHVKFDDWQGKWKSRNDSDDAVTIDVHPGAGRGDDESAYDGIKFTIIRTGRAERGEIHLTLHANVPHKKPHAICRYDIQNGGHKNPKWCKPKKLKSRQPHRHVYNPRCVRDGVPADWENFAEPLPLSLAADESVYQQIDRLTKMFLADLHVEFFDSSGQRHLYQHDAQ